MLRKSVSRPITKDNKAMAVTAKGLLPLFLIIINLIDLQPSYKPFAPLTHSKHLKQFHNTAFNHSNLEVHHSKS
jgi:hypothetical protein